MEQIFLFGSKISSCILFKKCYTSTVDENPFKQEVMSVRSRNESFKTDIITAVNDWYMTFRRSPTLDELATKVPLKRSAIHNYLRLMAEEGLINYDGSEIITDFLMKMNYERTPIRLLGTVPCGPLSEEENNVEAIYDLPVEIFGKGDLYMLHAKGDSMTGAGILDGDLLVIRAQEKAREGDIIVAYVEGEGNTVKRLRADREKKLYILHPENPDYPDIPVKKLLIQGVVVKVIHDVR